MESDFTPLVNEPLSLQNFNRNDTELVKAMSHSIFTKFK